MAVTDPVLLMVTVKPAALPGLTVAESAVLTTVSCGVGTELKTWDVV